MASVPEGGEMRVPLVTERKNEIFQVTMIRSADNKMAARPKHLRREPKQIARPNEMLDHLSGDSHIKALGADGRRIVIYSELVEHQVGRRTVRDSNAVGARLAPNHFVSSAGKL